MGTIPKPIHQYRRNATWRDTEPKMSTFKVECFADLPEDDPNRYEAKHEDIVCKCGFTVCCEQGPCAPTPTKRVLEKMRRIVFSGPDVVCSECGDACAQDTPQWQDWLALHVDGGCSVTPQPEPADGALAALQAERDR